MVIYWWTCPWCMDRMATKHTEAEVCVDRDAHLSDKHPHVVAAHEHLLAISHYRFLEVHQ